MAAWFDLYGEKLIKATFIHLGYVLLCVSIAFIIAYFLESVYQEYRGLPHILPIISIFQTVPGIVFVEYFIYLGMKPITIIVSTYLFMPYSPF